MTEFGLKAGFLQTLFVANTAINGGITCMKELFKWILLSDSEMKTFFTMELNTDLLS